ncbi:MAG: hypothetical protein AAFP76_04830 [Bacteroidota bacterium]
MKKIALFCIVLFSISCSNDDQDTAALTVTVQPIESLQVTINWTFTGGNGQTLYRVLLNDVVYEEAFSGTQYTFEIQNETAYNGVIYAISENGDETFATFNFTTVGSEIWYGDAKIFLGFQSENYPYRIVTGTFTITGDWNHISDLAGLEEVGNLHIRNVQNTTNLNGLSHLRFYNDNFGRIRIEECNDLTDVSAITQLKPFTGTIYLSENLSLNNLNGLSVVNNGNVTIIDMPLTDLSTLQTGTILNVLDLTGLPNLTSLNGLQNVQQITKSITLNNLPITNLDGLGNLSSYGQLRLISLANLNSLEALQGATMLEAPLSLIDLPNLTSLDGLEGVRNIKTSLSLTQIPNLTDINALLNVETFRATKSSSTFSRFNFNIGNCNSLQNLDAFQNVRYVGENPTREQFGLTIIQNDQLSNFCGFRNYVNSIPTGAIFLWSIYGNLYNPTPPDIKTGACAQ